MGDGYGAQNRSDRPSPNRPLRCDATLTRSASSGTSSQWSPRAALPIRPPAAVPSATPKATPTNFASPSQKNSSGRHAVLAPGATAYPMAAPATAPITAPTIMGRLSRPRLTCKRLIWSTGIGNREAPNAWYRMNSVSRVNRDSRHHYQPVLRNTAYAHAYPGAGPDPRGPFLGCEAGQRRDSEDGNEECDGTQGSNLRASFR